MYYLVDNDKKIIFGWSAKCGCSHVKQIFWYLNNKSVEIHTELDYCNIPEDIENYITIIFIRNPYKRVVSGFIDKYHPKWGQYREMWHHKITKFNLFVDELSKNDWVMIDKLHFEPQTHGDFNEKILQSKIFKCYDIENIDYKFIELIYNKKIPEIIINNKQGHERCCYTKDILIDYYVYDLELEKYYYNKIDIKYFYNDLLQDKIFNFYKNDFIFFDKILFKYYL